MDAIGKNAVVGLRYILRNSRHEVLEDISLGAPLYYLHGSAGISSSLQQQLEGLKQGDRKMVLSLVPAGLDIEECTYEVTVEEVRDAVPEEILLGYPVLSNNMICDEHCECHTDNNKKQIDENSSSQRFSG